MSTYYNFYCSKCSKRQKGISFTRQMWGWGNVDIIDSFRFLMKHTDLCGHEHIKILNREDDYDYDESKEDRDDDLNGYFPYSDDWAEDMQSGEWIKYQRYLHGDILEEEEVMTESKKDAPE